MAVPACAGAGRLALGAGVDYMVDARWRVRAEYLLADFRNLSALDHAGGVYPLKTRFHTFRLGVNYLLWAPEQAGTQSAPTFEPVWRGFTLGVVGGLGGNGVHVNYSEAGEGTRTSSSFGFLGGVSIGYDHRFSNKIILGGEADFQFANIESYRRKFDPAGVPEPGQPPDAPGTNGMTLRVENYATFRARLGYDMGKFAPFVTGGLAIGHVKFGQFDPSDIVATVTHRGNLQTGFTVGAGFEYALNERWTFKGEYAYVNLGRFGAAEVDQDAFKTQIQFSTIRAGLKYRF